MSLSLSVRVRRDKTFLWLKAVRAWDPTFAKSTTVSSLPPSPNPRPPTFRLALSRPYQSNTFHIL